MGEAAKRTPGSATASTVAEPQRSYGCRLRSTDPYPRTGIANARPLLDCGFATPTLLVWWFRWVRFLTWYRQADFPDSPSDDSRMGHHGVPPFRHGSASTACGMRFLAGAERPLSHAVVQWRTGPQRGGHGFPGSGDGRAMAQTSRPGIVQPRTGPESLPCREGETEVL